MIILASSFSLKMIDKESPRATLDVFPVSLDDVVSFLGDFPFKSIVGHPATAQVFSELLGVPIETNRVSYTIKNGDTLVVGLPSGERLPEGKILSKDEMGVMDWFIVRLREEE